MTSPPRLFRSLGLGRREASNFPSDSTARPPHPQLRISTLPEPTMLPTRALRARSVWKGPHIVPLPIFRPKLGERIPPIKTQARSAVILPNFVGLKFMIHNGKNYNEVTITEDMVGYKLGEFAATRKRFSYKQTKNK